MNSMTEYSDPDFGRMKHNTIDAWDCRVEFDFPHGKTNYFAVHIWAHSEAPTKKQRKIFRELKTRYDGLWPDIASSIIMVHKEIESQAELEAAMREWVAVHLGEHDEDSLELVIDLDFPDEGTRGYFIPIENWNVGKAVIAE